MNFTFALVGNQNCGKTTIFNALTKSNRHVGNFPGVTVDKKCGKIFNLPNATVIDLPGTNSLLPYTDEEILSCDFILTQTPDVIINVVDSTNLERNLYLTIQLLKLNVPTVIALTMTDELKKSGATINTDTFTRLLGVDAVCVNAKENKGIHELTHIALNTAKNHTKTHTQSFSYPLKINQVLLNAYKIISDAQPKFSEFYVESLFSSNNYVKNFFNLSICDKKKLSLLNENFEKTNGTKIDVAIASSIYNYTKKICNSCITLKNKTKNCRFADSILTNKFLAFPSFFVIMFSIFFITFGSFTTSVSDIFGYGINYTFDGIETLLKFFNVSENISNLVCNGILNGIKTIISFLPQILILFFLLSIAEDCGYMARIAFIFDKPFKKLGLSGRSSASFLLGFGCSVPAIMSSKTLFNKQERYMSVLLIPFMSCSAKLPVYAIFTHTFFPEYSAFIITGLYIFGIISAVFWALILKKSVFKSESQGYVMELPPYRMPTLKNVMLNVYDRAKDFISRVFKIVFLSSTIIWFLQNFDAHIHFTKNASTSLLFRISQTVSPVFSPLGFGNRYATSALISGLFAKETVVSTLATVCDTVNAGMKNALQFAFYESKASALSFLVFVLLYSPCIAAIGAVKRELNKKRYCIYTLFIQNLFAYICSFIVYHITVLILK